MLDRVVGRRRGTSGLNPEPGAIGVALRCRGATSFVHSAARADRSGRADDEERVARPAEPLGGLLVAAAGRKNRHLRVCRDRVPRTSSAPNPF